jgi:predicted metal-dependent hydrolase
MMLEQIVLPLEPPMVFVRHPRARRYVVRVRPDGSVRVTIPRWGSKKEAESFAHAQRAWIHKQLARVAVEQRAMRETLSPRELCDRREQASRELPPRLRELASLHGLNVSGVSIRDQKWRWGSCSRKGRICLNWRLVRMPDWVRDYVMIHELMHLKRMDHSPAFWELVARACPEYDVARRWLRSHQAGVSR